MQRVGQAGRDDVLGDVARHVAGRAVDLRRILARERAAAVRRRAAVGVDDDLAAGDAGVAVRTADDEAAGRVDVGSWCSCRSMLAGMTGLMIFSMMSSRSVSLRDVGLCWVETTTVSTRTGLPSSYSTVTCDLPSGRR